MSRPPQRPPLIISDPNDWAQYRMFVVESIRQIVSVQDETNKRLTALLIKIAAINAIFSLFVAIIVSIVAAFISKKLNGG